MLEIYWKDGSATVIHPFAWFSWPMQYFRNRIYKKKWALAEVRFSGLEKYATRYSPFLRQTTKEILDKERLTGVQVDRVKLK